MYTAVRTRLADERLFPVESQSLSFNAKNPGCGTVGS